MTSARALTSTAGLQIQIASGPRAGEAISFQQPLISIGRGPENDLAFTFDSKMSRHHAEIFFHNGTLWVRNVSKKNILFVNGVEVQSQALTHGSALTMGDTTLQIVMAHPQAVSSVRASAPAHGEPQASYGQPASNPEKVRFYLLVALIVIGGLWLFGAGKGGTKKEAVLPVPAQVSIDFQKSENSVKALEKKQESSGQQTLQYKMAQEHYLKGFRDYRQGQYARAISSFQAAISFFPQHELALKYLGLSKTKFSERVNFNMNQGKRYLGNNNYRLCKSSFANVMIMIKDPNDHRYIEARQFYNECSLKLEGKY